MNSKPMLNAYPDSLGRNLGDIVTLLKTEALQNVFSSFYILPSLYHSDLDRGFSVIGYDLNEQLADREDLDQLKNMGINLKLDFILNHASAQSPQFRDLVEKKISTVNMLGCHDGISLLDLKGLLPKEEIQSLIDRIVSRGGMVKNLHGQKNLYYQVNATYYSALGESDEKMLLARAIQMFMPGKSQIWYLDLFAGKNDHEAVQRAGESGHKEINRTNLSTDQITEGLKKDVVQKQLALIRMRNTHKAFSEGAEVAISGGERSLEIRWEYNSAFATLYVNFESGTYTIVESK
jgi:hypothetical protein